MHIYISDVLKLKLVTGRFLYQSSVMQMILYAISVHLGEWTLTRSCKLGTTSKIMSVM